MLRTAQDFSFTTTQIATAMSCTEAVTRSHRLVLLGGHVPQGTDGNMRTYCLPTATGNAPELKYLLLRDENEAGGRSGQNQAVQRAKATKAKENKARQASKLLPTETRKKHPNDQYI